MQSGKVIGILGGMGPRATVSFFDLVTKLTPAEKDWDHVRLVIDSNPHIPSRTRHYLYNEESPAEGMIESCKKLERWPVDVIVIPCNSACFFLPEIQPKIDVPILNIIEIASEALKKNDQNIKSCIVLGGRITYAEQTYKPYLKKHDVQFIQHDEELQGEIEDAIYFIKDHDDPGPVYEKWRDIRDAIFSKYNPDAIILGCTEFACILDYIQEDETEMTIVDSSSELAKYIVDHFA